MNTRRPDEVRAYTAADVAVLFDRLEKAILTHNEVDFVSVDGANYVFIGRVLREVDEAKQALRQPDED